MRDRHAILHIGVMKTATTTIQVWAQDNFEQLREQGIHLAQAFGASNHSRLAMLAHHFRRRRDTPMPPPQAQLLQGIQAELEGLGPEIHSVLYSAELLSEGLRTREQVAALKEMLDPHFTSHAVVVYLRRQDEHALSMLSTLLRVGKAPEALLQDPLATQPFDYGQLLSAWSAVFGRGAIRPRVFEPASLLGGDIIQDFAQAAGIRIGPEFRPAAKPLNPSLPPVAQALLLRLAEAYRSARYGGTFEDAFTHSRLRWTIERQFSGPGILPTRAEAMAFYDRCREANERVRAEWFPDRPRLFAEEFGSYPEAPAPRPTTEEVLDAAISILLAGLAERPK